MFQRRLTGVLLAVVASGGVLAACAEPTENSNAAEDNTAAAQEKTTLTVYTSEPEEKVDAINALFSEQYPDIEVEVYRAGTGDLNARIAAEKESGKIEADVLWAADAATFEKYAASNDLSELEGVDTEQVIEEARDPENYYVGTRIIPTVIAYNTSVISEDEAPKSWQDLVDPKYSEKIVLPNPAVSGAAAFNASVWKNDPALGEAWIKALGQNTPMIAESNGPTSQEIASGSRPVGIVVDYLVRDLAAKGSPIAISYPTEGVPYITEPAGVFEASENKEAAQTYINFLLSKEAQSLAVEQSYLPVRNDVKTPEGVPALEDITLMKQDLEKITADKEAAVKVFQDSVA
ncbi:ABC transporter substrate-binding protein [Corynebacterium sp. SCR221107]|uniref:ABC transporter substrate-binding protein n=1 Tax=Corynebacterium sp. SCR221107 TaxID=3017361 RepID=UPI0022EC3F72|nr:ABC transporter substrate-binding protein [Corynebacterium sp. SCR221107]WBT09760.1 ABC transporter substrate-binding protein [Corynebacterium sp. SCR221107]